MSQARKRAHISQQQQASIWIPLPSMILFISCLLDYSLLESTR